MTDLVEDYSKFKIKVLYKSGNSQEFWVYGFSVDGASYTWTSCDDNNKPLIIGVDNIEAIYQTGFVIGSKGEKE